MDRSWLQFLGATARIVDTWARAIESAPAAGSSATGPTVAEAAHAGTRESALRHWYCAELSWLAAVEHACSQLAGKLRIADARHPDPVLRYVCFLTTLRVLLSWVLSAGVRAVTRDALLGSFAPPDSKSAAAGSAAAGGDEEGALSDLREAKALFARMSAHVLAPVDDLIAHVSQTSLDPSHPFGAMVSRAASLRTADPGAALCRHV